MNDVLNRRLSDLLPLASSRRRPAGDDGLYMVRTCVRLRGQPPEWEYLWATPVEVDDRGRGTYMMRNNALLSALQVGDVVQVEGCTRLAQARRPPHGAVPGCAPYLVAAVHGRV